VSGYLMRLIMRTRVPTAGQLLQPLVRSTSPVAEWDQRIGMMSVEGSEFDESLLREATAEAGLEQDGALQALRLSNTTAAGVPEEVPSAGETAPWPQTAASVSVTGPLSGGVRPNLYLSLRHR
jgi:hypothetical protein